MTRATRLALVAGGLIALSACALAGFGPAQGGSSGSGGGSVDLSDVDQDVALRSDHELTWSNSTSTTSTKDVGLARNAAGVLTLTDGNGADGGVLRLGDASSPTDPGDFGTGSTGGPREVWVDASAARLYIVGAGGATQTQLQEGQLQLFDSTSSMGLRFLSDTSDQSYIRGEDGMSLEWTSSNATGSADVALERDAAGVLKVTDGSTGFGALIAKGVPQRLSVDTTTVGNVGGGTDPLMSYEVASGTLGDDDEVRIVGRGTYASNSGTRAVNFNVAGSTVYAGSFGSGANGASWRIEASVVRISATDVRVFVTQPATSSTSFQQGFDVSLTVSTLDSNTLTLAFTGSDSNSNTDEVQQHLMTVDLVRAP